MRQACRYARHAGHSARRLSGNGTAATEAPHFQQTRAAVIGPARAAGSRPADVGVGRRMEVFALLGELPGKLQQLRQASVRRADGHALLAARFAARLARVEPVLARAGEQAVGDIPDIRLLVLLGHAVTDPPP